jgi:hypothetical protein
MLALTPLAPANAQEDGGSELYGDINGWTVFKAVVPGKRNRCELYAETNLYTLLVAFDPFKDGVLLGFSIQDGANFAVGKSIDIQVALTTAQNLDPDWIYADAGVGANRNGEDHRTFYSKMPSTETFLRRFARADNIAIFTDPNLRLLVTVNLEGSSKAVDLLRKCAYSLKAQ